MGKASTVNLSSGLADCLSSCLTDSLFVRFVCRALLRFRRTRSRLAAKRFARNRSVLSFFARPVHNWNLYPRGALIKRARCRSRGGSSLRESSSAPFKRGQNNRCEYVRVRTFVSPRRKHVISGVVFPGSETGDISLATGARILMLVWRERECEQQLDRRPSIPWPQQQ